MSYSTMEAGKVLFDLFSSALWFSAQVMDFILIEKWCSLAEGILCWW